MADTPENDDNCPNCGGSNVEEASFRDGHWCTDCGWRWSE